MVPPTIQPVAEITELVENHVPELDVSRTDWGEMNSNVLSLGDKARREFGAGRIAGAFAFLEEAFKEIRGYNASPYHIPGATSGLRRRLGRVEELFYGNIDQPINLRG